MNAKNLPIQVAEEWQQIARFIKEQIVQSGLIFDIKLDKNLGIKIIYKNYKQIFFQITDYKIDGADPTAYYFVSQVPENRHTVIEESLEIVYTLRDFQVKKRFTDWIRNVENFEQLDTTDLTNIFDLEDSSLAMWNKPYIYSEEDQILTYCLKSLSVSNFQGVKQATIENLPVDTSWVFLVGENGFGKSTILQSIALGLHGSKDGPYDYGKGDNCRIRIEYKSDEENRINDFKSNPLPLAHIAAYGPVRLNMQVDASITEAAQKSGTLYSLFRTDGVLLNIESELVKWHLKGDKRFKLVKNAFRKLVPYLDDIRFDPSNDTIKYIEKDVVDGNSLYDPLPFEKIASGFRSILGVAGDMIVRLTSTQKEVENPSELKGIVIIDELDLHWHPKLQKKIPELFSQVFPNIQFIVSTHSPIPLLGAPKNSVILKINRTKEEGITIQKVDIDLKNLTPNLLLTSGIFDMDDIFSSQADDLTQVRTEDTFVEMNKNDDVDKFLKTFETSDQQFPDELFESTNK